MSSSLRRSSSINITTSWNEERLPPQHCTWSPILSPPHGKNKVIQTQHDHHHSNNIAPFLVHLHTILNHEDPNIVRWTMDGLAFEILDKARLVTEILPKYFNLRSFSSFQRQLNYFRFKKWHKSRSPCDYSTYSQEYFRREGRALLHLIKRTRKPASRETTTTESVHKQTPGFSSVLFPSSSSSSSMEPRRRQRLVRCDSSTSSDSDNSHKSTSSTTTGIMDQLMDTSVDVPDLASHRQQDPTQVCLPSIQELMVFHFPRSATLLEQLPEDLEIKTSKGAHMSTHLPPSISPFLRTLFGMLEDPENHHLIAWSHAGKAFEIKDVQRLTSELLPRYFRSRKLASFKRNLNLYGFKTWAKSSPGLYKTFSHPSFQRQEPMGLSNIQRNAACRASSVKFVSF